MLDIGTGSGILAVAALKLGAAEAEGVDIDPMCVRTAGENAQRNGVADHFKVLVGDLSDQASGQYNIITANIVAAAILSLAPRAAADGPARFIASGIITERKDEVLTGLQAAGLAPIEVKESAGWVCIICEKKRRKVCRIVILPGSWPMAAPLTAAAMPTTWPTSCVPNWVRKSSLCGPDGLEYLGTVTAIEPGRVEFSVTDGNNQQGRAGLRRNAVCGLPQGGQIRRSHPPQRRAGRD